MRQCNEDYLAYFTCSLTVTHYYEYFSLNILTSNRAGGFYLSFFFHLECFANAFSHFPGQYFQEEDTENWEWMASQGQFCLGVWETANNSFPVGFREVVGMRRERSKSCCVRQRWNQERRQGRTGEGPCGSVPREEGGCHYSNLLGLEGIQRLGGHVLQGWL